MLWFGEVALCFFTSTRALLSVVGTTIGMVLLCHLSASESSVCNDATWGISQVTSDSDVREILLIASLFHDVRIRQYPTYA